MSDFASITLPDRLAFWFKRIGCSDVVTATSKLGAQGIENLIMAHDKFVLKHSVCLFIQSNILTALINGSKPSSPTWYPDRWIVLISKIQLDGVPLSTNLNRNSNVAASAKGLTFDVYSWGNTYSLQVEPEVFLKYYHGFVSAKWS